MVCAAVPTQLLSAQSGTNDGLTNGRILPLLLFQGAEHPLVNSAHARLQGEGSSS
jgi:hypothetical protein